MTVATIAAHTWQIFVQVSRILLSMQWLRQLSRSKQFFTCSVLYLFAVTAKLWYGFTHSIFGQDQARDALYMLQFSQSNDWIIGYGPKAGVGNFYLPQLYYQIHLFFSTVSGFDPLVMKWVTIVIEAATPVLIFLILKKFTSPVWAITIAIFYSVSATPFTFSTFAWNPNMIPFFSTLAVFAWINLLENYQKRWIFVGVLSVTVAVHFHFQSAVLLPFGLIVFALDISRHFNHLKYWLAAAVLAVLTLTPYFIQELNTDWHNTRQIVSYFSQEHSQYYDRTSKPDYVFRFFPGFIERVIISDNKQFYWFGSIIFFVGLCCGTVAAIKSRLLRIILFYLLILFAMLRLYKGDKLDYQLSILFILPSLLLGMITRYLPNRLVVLLLPLILYTALLLVQRPYINDYQTSVEMQSYIESVIPSRELSILFLEDDAINVLGYQLLQSAYTIRPSSDYLLEVCASIETCGATAIPRCSNSRAETYSNLLKQTAQYQFLNTKVFKSYRLSIGTLANAPQEIGYSIYDESYGNDMILTGMYTK